MKTTTLELTPRDPIVSRDGRPFGEGQGNRMRSVGWPLPAMIAGSLRTALGKGADRDFSLATAAELLNVAVAGVFPTVNGRLYLPAPHDCVVRRSGNPLRPIPRRALPQPAEACGGNWPGTGLLPVMLSEGADDEELEPIAPPAWWPIDRFVDWLIEKDFHFDETFLKAPLEDERTHVAIEATTGAAKDQHLFTTSALPLTHLERHTPTTQQRWHERFEAIRLAVRVEAEGWCQEQAQTLSGHHPTGGERRLVHWQSGTTNEDWDCPKPIRDALSSSTYVRLALATPAIFEHGWKPGWLDDGLVGSPPGTNVRLQLMGVTIPRWRAVSGWSLAPIDDQGRLDPGGKSGQKPIRRMVPAGGVYFFEIVDGSPGDLADGWLRSVSDGEQDQRDGFGLATWGIWPRTIAGTRQ